MEADSPPSKLSNQVPVLSQALQHLNENTTYSIGLETYDRSNNPRMISPTTM